MKCLPNNIDYQPNNIDFRIQSSKILAKFKFQQSNIFKELIFNAPGHNFSYTAKEIVLLKYNIWFYYLVCLEQKLLEFKNKKASLDEIKEYITKQAKNRFNCYYDILFSQKNLDKKFLNIWKELHSYFENYFIDFINEIETTNIIDIFSKIGNEIIELLRLTIYEVYEIDSLLEGNFIIYIDDYYFKIDEKYILQYFEKKLKLFNNFYKGKKLIIKSYIDYHKVKNSDLCKLIENFAKENNLKIIIE